MRVDLTYDELALITMVIGNSYNSDHVNTFKLYDRLLVALGFNTTSDNNANISKKVGFTVNGSMEIKAVRTEQKNNSYATLTIND